VQVTKASDLAADLDLQIGWVVGSGGAFTARIDAKWGRVAIVPVIVGDAVEIRIVRPDGVTEPLTAENFPPACFGEFALGYVIGRLLCRGWLSAAEVRRAEPLPSGRTLTELRAVEIALMPQGLHLALEELHVIGFTGMPTSPPNATLIVENGPVFPAHVSSVRALQDEIDALVARMIDKFRPIRAGADRFEAPTIRTVRVDGEVAGVRLEARDWSHGGPDVAILQWVLTHLLRPRRVTPFLPMRELVILPREIPPCPFLADGRHLADLPAIRHQLMPSKLAQILNDLHRHGTGAEPRLTERGEGTMLRFGPLRIGTRDPERDRLIQQATDWVRPLVDLFRHEEGGEAKYGPVTLEIVPGDREISFRSANFLPGCPDEILCEYLVARWLQDDTIPPDSVRTSRRIGKRSVVAAPSIVCQLVPGGTTELIESVHTGRFGAARRESGWKHQIDS
jgi:hypothetical protein